MSSSSSSGSCLSLQASLVERTRVLCDATALARDLANERGDVAHPEFMALAAEQVA